jgi:hypothetical protein
MQSLEIIEHRWQTSNMNNYIGSFSLRLTVVVATVITLIITPIIVMPLLLCIFLR